MNEEALKAQVTSLLNTCNVMSLATVSDNAPWAAAVFFAADSEFRMYFISGETSRHSLNIKSNTSAAATVNKDHDDWLTIAGLQVEGEVSIVGMDKRSEVLELYLKKFPNIARLSKNPNNMQEKKIADRIVTSTLYQLTPSLVKIIDNTQGFGKKFELTF